VAVQVYPPNYPSPVQYSDKSRVAAGVLQILLPFGVGRFYTGHIGIAVGQLLTSVFFIGVIWSIVDGIILLTSGGTDRYGRPLHM
jgi:TM2 domain-containing membrane protein YozV